MVMGKSWCFAFFFFFFFFFLFLSGPNDNFAKFCSQKKEFSDFPNIHFDVCGNFLLVNNKHS